MSEVTLKGQVLPIEVEKALEHGFRRPDSMSFAANQALVPVHLVEVASVVHTMPIALARLPSDQYVVVAVAGFDDNRNLLVDAQGRWGGLYLPMDLRTYPFRLQDAQPLDGGEQRYAVLFDHGSGLYREAPSGDELEPRFFTDEGKPQDFFAKVLEQLKETVSASVRTQAAANALVASGVLIPWQIEGVDAEHAAIRLPVGLYRVDENKLAALDGAALQAMHRASALGLAYAQLFSMSRLSVLVRLLEARIKRDAQQPQANLTKNIDELLKF